MQRIDMAESTKSKGGERTNFNRVRLTYAHLDKPDDSQYAK